MRQSELVVGTEYAIGRYGNQFEIHDRPFRGKFLGLEDPVEHVRSRRLALFEAIEPFTHHMERFKAGQRFYQPPARVWCTWANYEELVAEHERFTQAREEIGRRVLAALDSLGLHALRGFVAAGTIEQATAVVSGAELEKLAARAEHLVELERLMRVWYANKLGEGSAAPDQAFLVSFEAKLAKWTQAHDFSMLDRTEEA